MIGKYMSTGKRKEFAKTNEWDNTTHEDGTSQKLACGLLTSDEFNLPLYAVRTSTSSNELQLRL
jgi:hypothetical protein